MKTYQLDEYRSPKQARKDGLKLHTRQVQESYRRQWVRRALFLGLVLAVWAWAVN